MKHLVLVGLPGVGKSTVGRELARRLGRSFVDLDLCVERSFGKSVVRVFAEDGEPAFRDAEAAATLAVGAQPPAVISPGGGWILNGAATAHLLDNSRIIYLRVSADAAVRRMGGGIERRPLFRDAADPYRTMHRLYEERSPRYEELAWLTVDTTGSGRSQVISRVVEEVLAAERNVEGRE
ncbi:MAG: shikimate kinase [Gemmatimonadota bacterium]|nr:shikimate kinase [Gemmatimonadota bacterium]